MTQLIKTKIDELIEVLRSDYDWSNDELNEIYNHLVKFDGRFNNILEFTKKKKE